MKKTLLFIAAILAQLSSFATNFAGIISANTTWTKANSPYIITGQVLVNPDVLLTIEPGVEVRMTGNYEFFVDGSLYASGTATDSILFISPDSLIDWKGILCREKTGKDSVIFRFCRIEKKIKAGNSLPEIKNDNIRLVIENSKVHNIVVNASGQVNIKNNTFINSPISIYYLSGSSEISGNNVSYQGMHINRIATGTMLQIKNNKISHCNTGISLFASNNVIVENNICVANKTGMHCGNPDGGNQLVRNNIFAYNETGLSVDLHGGLLTQNTIKHNNTGIYLIWSDTDPHLSLNCIDSNSVFNVKLSGNARSSVLQLQNNYWGTADSTLIRSSIYDFYRDFNLSEINYMPVAQSSDVNCTTVANPTAIRPLMEQQQQPELYPNPFSSSFNIKAPGIIKEVAVYNIVGTKLVSAQPKAATALIDMANMPGGIYIYRMELADGSQYTGKLKKE